MSLLSSALVVALFVSAVAVATAPAATSAATASCGAQVVNDWYVNDRIDRTYPIACYRAALSQLPTAVHTYTDANDVITQAMQLAIIRGGDGGRPRGRPPVSKTVHNIGSSSATSVPIPLIVLGALALLLLAAGAAGVIARKLQERRMTATPRGS